MPGEHDARGGNAPPRTIGVVPARYDSRRWPGKALALVDGRPLIASAWRSLRATPELERAFIATDDGRIAEWARYAGAEVLMTSSECRNGTERVAEVAATHEADIYVNVQADQVGLESEAVSRLVMHMAANPDLPMATLARPVGAAHEFLSSDHVFVRKDRPNVARSFRRGGESMPAGDWLRHIGVYAYRAAALAAYAAKPPGIEETIHSLEQLRGFDLNWEIGVVEVESNARSFDRMPGPDGASGSGSLDIDTIANRVSTYAR